VIDIGANVGAHTLALAQLVGKDGKVFAFEPTEFAYGKLKRNLELNSEPKKRVMGYQCFLGSSDDMPIPSAICSSWPLIGDSTVHPKHLGEAMSTDQAASRSLDSIWFEHNCPRIQLVKMDVDGFECVVLSGARKLMERDRPIFILELSPYILTEQNASLESLMSYFVPLGYRFYDVKTEAELPQHPKMLEAKIGDGASINAIARPTGRSTLP
jgi:FkbM family methyltransferase